MRSLVALALTLLALAFGCGPVEYISQVPRGAAPAVEASERAANDESPEYYYWHTLAVEYLRKAREEAALADFQAANRFGRLAEEAAQKAQDVAASPRLSFPEGFAPPRATPGANGRSRGPRTGAPDEDDVAAPDDAGTDGDAVGDEFSDSDGSRP